MRCDQATKRVHEIPPISINIGCSGVYCVCHPHGCCPPLCVASDLCTPAAVCRTNGRGAYPPWPNHMLEGDARARAHVCVCVCVYRRSAGTARTESPPASSASPAHCSHPLRGMPACAALCRVVCVALCVCVLPCVHLEIGRVVSAAVAAVAAAAIELSDRQRCPQACVIC